MNGIECLEQAFKLAGNGTLVINGDLFHDRKHIPIEVLHLVSEVFCRHSNTRVILNIGNHDQFLRDGRMHSTQIFKGMENVVTVEEGTTLSSPPKNGLPDIVYHVHPFTTDLEAFRKWVSTLEFDSSNFNMLVVHQAVEGSLLAKGVKSKGGLTLGDLRYTEVDAVMLGHYHRPQALAKNVWYIGSPYEVDEGEAGDEKRFMTISSSPAGWAIKSVPVVGMPSHRRWESVESFKAKGSENDFNIIECSSQDEAKSLGLNCKPVVKASKAVSTDVEVGDVSIEEAVSISLRGLGREDLFEKKARRRLGL
jgi:DNA repair exonuclease SbcCD nuclease subunit